MLIETNRQHISDISLGDIVQVKINKKTTRPGVVIRKIIEFDNGVKKNFYDVAFANKHECGLENDLFAQNKVKKIGVEKMDLKIGDKVTVFTGESFVDLKITKIERTKKGVIKDIEGETSKGECCVFRKENIAGRY